MDIRREFEYDGSIDVNASQIGVSKWTWTSINNENEIEASNIMRNSRFDVLPVIDSDGNCKKYFVTQNWNDYSNLNLNNINHTETIYYKTSLRDLIKKFESREKHYFFLKNHDEILGLVSFVNLNCQLVYNYLFHVISDIERTYAAVLKNNLNQYEILEELKKSEDSHLIELCEILSQNISLNLDQDIFQHMYLQTLGITFKKFKNKISPNYLPLLKYVKKMDPNGVYGILRNIVMHPVRPILNKPSRIKEINELLNDYVSIKMIFNNSK